MPKLKLETLSSPFGAYVRICVCVRAINEGSSEINFFGRIGEHQKLRPLHMYVMDMHKSSSATWYAILWLSGSFANSLLKN